MISNVAITWKSTLYVSLNQNRVIHFINTEIFKCLLLFIKPSLLYKKYIIFNVSLDSSQLL